jgi:heat shock protein HslJ
MKDMRPIATLALFALTACAQTPMAETPKSLSNTRWMGVIDSSIDKRATPWLEFVGENRVSGYSGCNMVNGTWRMEGEAVKLGPLMATKRGCLGPEGDLEKRVLAALTEQGRGTREGSKLVFTAPGGQRFEFVEAK